MKPDLRKILILRFSSFGDIVMTTAMIRCLRRAFPNAQIDMVVREDFADVIRHNPHLNQKIYLSRQAGFSGLLKLLKQLNQERYDLIYDAHRSLRTRFLMPFLIAPRKRYFQKHYLRRALALTLKMPMIQGMGRFLTRYIDPLTDLGVIYDGHGPEVIVSELAEKTAAQKISLPPMKGLRIAFIPSAQWPGKRWPPQYFRTLAQLIIEKSPHQILVFGGKFDSFCQEISAGLPSSRLQNLQGMFSIEESGAAIKTCAVTVANDTGLMHMADGLNIPSVLFLGPTSEDLGCLPFHPETKVLERKLWCRPCSKNGQSPCIRFHRYCLLDIKPEEAFATILKLLAGKTA